MNYKKTRIQAVVLTLVLLGALFLVPASSLDTDNENTSMVERNNMVYRGTSFLGEEFESFRLDRNYNLYPGPAPINRDDNDDAGYRVDARDKLNQAYAIYPGEIVDDTPGRGRTGKLHDTNDLVDWYFFTVCEGQEIEITMTPPATFDYDLSLWDEDEIMRAESSTTGSATESITYTADYTGRWYMNISYIDGTGEDQYSFTIAFNNQNDADTLDDAGDTFATATTITPGIYNGYLDMNDAYDWYKFDVVDGDGIHFILKMRSVAYLADFDIHLYNPSEELVYEETYYYDDELYYPIDESGEWRIKLDIFPGWVDCPQPTEWDYYEYGSGPYELEFAIENDVPAPPAPIPQPDIIPIAKTFTVTDVPESNTDEYGYLASVPACNYLEGGDRYLAPIVYEGDDTSTNYYGTEYDRGVVDDTTQYLIDDWNDYLDLFGKSAYNYNVPSNPIEAAAEIATENWDSSDLAVVAVDGSGYEDDVRTVISRTRTLRRDVEFETLDNNDERIQDIGGTHGYPMTLKPKWCAINVSMSAGGAEPTLNTILPHFMQKQTDWWPYTYDGDGPKVDIYYPVTRSGVWTAGATTVAGDWDFEITKYYGHRYRFRVKDSDSVINVKIETDEPSDLLVFLVDPEGYLRSPDVPQWNGPVNPMHMWNGCHFDPDVHGFDAWRTWNPEPHTEFAAEVLHPEKGMWTAIVVPRDAEGENYRYHITGEVTYTNEKRADAAISAANAAVIASQENVPLLYVNEDSIPAETTDAFDTLGVENVIFVERGEIGSAVRSSLPIETDLTTMQEIVDHIKGYDSSENYITVTSIKYSKGESTNQPMQNGYFAPAAMIGAYYGSPVLRIGDATVDGILRTKVNPAGMADRIETQDLWDGDFYHGSRSTGHLPIADAPVEQNKLKILIQMVQYLINGEGELPPFGLDAKRYWNAAVHDGIYDYISGLGLDLEGQEAYCFVAPRKDIYIPVHSVMMGNNSYAGQIVGETPAYSSAVVARTLLYPAIIYANPSRDVTTTQLMNFPDGGTWQTNDGQSNAVYSTRIVKKSFGSHGRTYIGHCLWDAHLERMNEGASAMYYSGHGTGGSGISAQYHQTEFCNYPDQIWWDCWRGYTYDNWKMPRNNGQVWYNADPPNLYDIIHYDYNDELLGNLRSNAIFYMSCTTADADGPMVYMDHGAVIYYGNARSGLCPEADLQDDEFFVDAMINGESVGQAYSHQVWLHFRDFTTGDNASMYGPSTMRDISTVQCIYGDPNLIVYSPEWTIPTPVDV